MLSAPPKLGILEACKTSSSFFSGRRAALASHLMPGLINFPSNEQSALGIDLPMFQVLLKAVIATRVPKYRGSLVNSHPYLVSVGRACSGAQGQSLPGFKPPVTGRRPFVFLGSSMIRMSRIMSRTRQSDFPSGCAKILLFNSDPSIQSIASIPSATTPQLLSGVPSNSISFAMHSLYSAI